MLPTARSRIGRFYVSCPTYPSNDIHKAIEYKNTISMEVNVYDCYGGDKKTIIVNIKCKFKVLFDDS